MYLRTRTNNIYTVKCSNLIIVSTGIVFKLATFDGAHVSSWIWYRIQQWENPFLRLRMLIFRGFRS
jgi:hypothetical protein